MEFTHVSAAGGQCSVRVAGPDSRHAVLLLPDAGDPVDVYDAVSERLHNSDLKTVALESIDGVSDDAILTVLDELKLSWVHLVGSGAGAESAWTLAAKTFGRFASLIVVNRCHPAIADEQGTVRDADCPPVELPTTLVVGSSLRRASADASGRFVYSDFRVVQLDGSANVVAAEPAALATEIVLRTSPW
ncbi:alpha/beta fold hydrolase [Rhodococcoides navarretei]|uniref:Alpha/beta hydrolase n=1 Tax=Rhodococcus navarretei TaxID=3128981 RepID=A0ABU9CX45_9NOCA